MSKHTPGPWTTNGYSIGIPKGTVAQMCRPGDQSGRGLTQEEQEANARLIASAPELLAACKLACEELERHRPKGNIRDIFTALNHHENDVMKPLRSAIARAEGGGE